MGKTLPLPVWDRHRRKLVEEWIAWDRLDHEQKFPIKGHSLDASCILGNAERARPYIDGPILLARLSPLDYHHVRYPDEAEHWMRTGSVGAFGR